MVAPHWSLVEPSSSVPTSPSWASPGATVDAPRFRSVPTIFDEPRPSTAALGASPVSRLQPRTVGQLLDGGFEVLRFRVRTISIVAAVLVLPLYVLPQLVASLGSDAIDWTTFDPTRGILPSDAGTTSLWAGAWAGVAAGLGLMYATMLLGVGVTHLVGAWLMGHDPGPSATLRFVRSRLGAATGAFALALLIKVGAAAFSCGLALIYVVPALSVLAPVVALEPVGAGSAVSRSFALSRRRFGQLLGVSLLWALASGVVSTVASSAGAIVGALVGQEQGALIAAQAVDVMATVVLVIVQVSVTALVYIDLRVRTEGLDLELEASERFRAGAR